MRVQISERFDQESLRLSNLRKDFLVRVTIGKETCYINLCAVATHITSFGTPFALLCQQMRLRYGCIGKLRGFKGHFFWR